MFSRLWSVVLSLLLCHTGSLLHSTLIFKVSIPITEGLDLIAMLTDDATVASWNNEGLPSDRMSTENAAILTHCERWPLMIDPQQQGMKWIKNKYGTDLKVTHLGQKGYVESGRIGFLLICCEMGLISTKFWHLLDLSATMQCDSMAHLVHLLPHASHKVSSLKGYLC